MPKDDAAWAFLSRQGAKIGSTTRAKALPFELRLGTVDAGRGRGCRAGEGKEARKR